MNEYVRPSTLDDVELLAQNLRPEDIAEIAAASGMSPYSALSHGLEKSRYCFTMEAEGDLVGMFGVVPSELPGVGVIWLLATPNIEKHALKFLRRSRAWADALNQEFPILWNVVDARNELHLKWLKWLDFEIAYVHPEYGPEKRLFYEIVRRQNV